MHDNSEMYMATCILTVIVVRKVSDMGSGESILKCIEVSVM